MWKKLVIAYFKILSQNCLQALRTNTKIQRGKVISTITLEPEKPEFETGMIISIGSNDMYSYGKWRIFLIRE
jgi:hypothetical protein